MERPAAILSWSKQGVPQKRGPVNGNCSTALLEQPRFQNKQASIADDKSTRGEPERSRAFGGEQYEVEHFAPRQRFDGSSAREIAPGNKPASVCIFSAFSVSTFHLIGPSLSKVSFI